GGDAPAFPAHVGVTFLLRESGQCSLEGSELVVAGDVELIAESLQLAVMLRHRGQEPPATGHQPAGIRRLYGARPRLRGLPLPGGLPLVLLLPARALLKHLKASGFAFLRRVVRRMEDP